MERKRKRPFNQLNRQENTRHPSEIFEEVVRAVAKVYNEREKDIPIEERPCPEPFWDIGGPITPEGKAWLEARRRREAQIRQESGKKRS